jgi:hypothetical protein
LCIEQYGFSIQRPSVGLRCAWCLNQQRLVHAVLDATHIFISARATIAVFTHYSKLPL